MSKLLINEYPLVVLPTLAVRIGLNEAIMLQQIQYWISHPKSIEKEGRHWHFDTYGNWLLQFPFWSLRTLTRVAKSLRDQRLVIAKAFRAQFNDQTLWYTIDYEQVSKLELAMTCAQVYE